MGTDFLQARLLLPWPKGHKGHPPGWRRPTICTCKPLCQGQRNITCPAQQGQLNNFMATKLVVWPQPRCCTPLSSLDSRSSPRLAWGPLLAAMGATCALLSKLQGCHLCASASMLSRELLKSRPTCACSWAIQCVSCHPSCLMKCGIQSLVIRHPMLPY